jgi:hypothetical protein
MLLAEAPVRTKKNAFCVKLFKKARALTRKRVQGGKSQMMRFRDDFA